MDKQSALDVAYEWLIQHPQVDDEEVDWAREAIQGMIDENSALASWQCLYTDGKEGIVCDDYGSQHCAKQAVIDEAVWLLTHKPPEGVLSQEYLDWHNKHDSFMAKHRGEQ